MRAESAPKHQSMPGSTVKAVSPASMAEEKLKTSSLIISDLISSRDSISLSTIFELERIFEMELVSKEDWMSAAEGYWSYVKNGERDD